MPLLGALLSSLFTALGGFLAKLFLARLALRLVGVTALAATAAVLMATFNNVIAPLVAQAFNTQYGQILGLAFPPISGTCIAAFVTIWSACGLYRLNAQAVKATTGIG